MGALASDLTLTIHPHPTLSETVMEAADVFFGESPHVYKPKKTEICRGSTMRRERTPSASTAPAGRENSTSATALAASSASALVVTVRTSIGDP
jgi:hypothetical protein